GTTTRLSSGAMCDKRRPGCAMRSSGACCGNRSSDFFVHHVTVLCSITTLAKQTEKEDSAMLPALHNPARAVLLAALLGGSALSVPTAVRAQSVTPERALMSTFQPSQPVTLMALAQAQVAHVPADRDLVNGERALLNRPGATGYQPVEQPEASHTVGLESRYSRLEGVPNVGDFVNPAYTALNSLMGQNRFPTNLDVTLPQRHDSHLELRQPLFNAGVIANYGAARSRYDGQRFGLAAAARRLAADVQTAYLTEASARRAVEIYAASLALVQENERVAGRLLAAGRATPEAVFRARADRSEIEQLLAEARQRHAAAGRALNQVLRRPLEAPIAVIPDSGLDLPLAIDVDSSVAHALAHREELWQLDAGIRTAEAGVRGASAAL